MVGLVNITPEAVLLAAAELDLLADRLAAAGAITAPATHVIPSGAEEVSLLAANHFNKAAGSHDRVVAQGVLELHHAANVLRAQLAAHISEDAAKASIMSAVSNTIV